MSAKRMNAIARAVAIAGTAAGLPVVCAAQAAIGPPTTHQSSSSIRNPLGSDLDNGPSPFPDTSAQKRNEDRQRRIVSDTQRLLYLADRLKAEIAASGAESMTPEMLKEMDEIEKLARNVKDRMRN